MCSREPEACAGLPDLAQFGLYRKLDSGEWEFIAYCSLASGPLKGHAFFGFYDDDLEAILNGTLPKKEARAFKQDIATMRARLWTQTN